MSEIKKTNVGKKIFKTIILTILMILSLFVIPLGIFFLSIGQMDSLLFYITKNLGITIETNLIAVLQVQPLFNFISIFFGILLSLLVYNIEKIIFRKIIKKYKEIWC